jgi:hypothetical protein
MLEQQEPEELLRKKSKKTLYMKRKSRPST